ncbi:MAG: hypothetical protein R3B09_15920 [Nannocystaceae bacterium]
MPRLLGLDTRGTCCSFGLSLSLAIAAAGCGDPSGEPEASATLTTTTTDECASTTTTAGTTGGWSGPLDPLTDTMWETTTTSTTDASDFLALGACPLAAPCEPFWLQGVEGSADPFHEDRLEIERCILQNLRDGVPGRYRHTATTHYTNGSSVVDTLFHVSADRRVSFTGYTQAVNFGGDYLIRSETYSSARTCVLASSAFFEGCLENHTNEGIPPDCMGSIEGWWSKCVAGEVSCPCGGEPAGGGS